MLDNYMKNYGKWSWVTSILMIAVAIVLIVKPLELVSTVIIIFGSILIIAGILSLISYFKTNNEYRIMNFALMNGIIIILLGILAITMSNALIAFLPVMLAVWIIIKSVMSFQIAINLKSIHTSNWRWILVTSIITFILGLIIILNPFKSAAIAIRIIGIILVFTEITNIIETYILRKINY